MKKFVVLLLAAMMLLAMVACGNDPQPTPEPDPTPEPTVDTAVVDELYAAFDASMAEQLGETPAPNGEKIGAVIISLTNQFWANMKVCYEAAAEKLGVQIDVQTGTTEGDTQSQLDVLMTMADMDYDVIIVSPIDGTNLIPGIRFDYHNQFGSNWSPSLNVSQALGDMFTLKAGIARVFKAPNLYQSSEGYLLSTRGNGCPNTIAEGSCYLLGNPDLDPEISINKEIGIEFNLNGYAAGVTWFRNDYKNKIVSGTEVLGYTSSGNNILQWQNGGKAVVEGLEGNLLIPVLRDVLSWRTNATWMLKSESKETGNPLSVIPKYTVNTMLDWQVNDALSANVNWTLYGRQKPRQYAEIRNETGTLATTEVGAYSIVGIGTQYQLNRDIRLNAGISNLFDKQLYRENAGASTYNEPGRAYYAGVTLSF